MKFNIFQRTVFLTLLIKWLWFFPQLICEEALLLSATGIGLYYRALTERAHRNTFAGTRTCLEQRVKLECESEQQERLLLSVIPAYIAAEVCNFFYYRIYFSISVLGNHMNHRIITFTNSIKIRSTDVR